MARNPKENKQETTEQPGVTLVTAAEVMNSVLGLNPPIDTTLAEAELEAKVKIEAGSIGVNNDKFDEKLYNADKDAFNAANPDVLPFLESIGAIDHVKDALAKIEEAANAAAAAAAPAQTGNKGTATAAAGTGSPMIPAVKQMDVLKDAIAQGGGTMDEIIVACDKISKEKGGKGCTASGKDDIKWLFDLMGGVGSLTFKDGKLTK